MKSCFSSRPACILDGYPYNSSTSCTANVSIKNSLVVAISYAANPLILDISGIYNDYVVSYISYDDKQTPINIVGRSKEDYIRIQKLQQAGVSASSYVKLTLS